MKIIVVIGIIIVVLLIVSGTGFYQNKQLLNSVKTELKASQDNITHQNILIDNLSKELIDLQSQVNTKDKELIAKDTEISELSRNLALIETQFSQINDGYNNTKRQFTFASLEIENLHQKIKDTADTLGEVDTGIVPDGFIDNGRFVISKRHFYLTRNLKAVDPTWEELIDFLENDQTDKKLYIENEFTCGNFAEDVYNNAEAQGIRAAIVLIAFKDDMIGHAINAFKTTDYGLVYIDCTGDKTSHKRSLDSEAEVKIGQKYERELIFSNDYFESLGVVKAINIYW
jgi:hypothetical protein